MQTQRNMATRRLKFKPKPSVSNSMLRRGRDKEELPGLTENKQIIEKESSVTDIRVESITPGSNEEHCNLSPEPTTNCYQVGLNVQQNTQLFTASNLKQPSEVGEPEKTSISDSPANTLSNEHNSENILPDSPSASLNSDKCSISSTITYHIKESETPPVLNNSQINSLNSEVTDVNINSAVPPLISSSVKECDTSSESNSNYLPPKDSSSDNRHEKPDSVKILSRFGRARCKPVLNNKVLRKKVEITNSEQSTIANVRTDSVIKSVKSELSKINVVGVANEENISLSVQQDKGSESDLSKSSSSKNCFGHIDKQNGIVNKNPIISQVNNFLKSALRTENKNQENENSSSPISIFHHEDLDNMDDITNKPNMNENQEKLINSSSITNTKTVNNLPISPKKLESNLIVNKNQEVSNRPNANCTSKTQTNNKIALSPLRPTAKMLVPKPSPRLRDAASRRISFQGSDSEEDSKRGSTKLKEVAVTLKNDKVLKTSKRKRSLGSTYSKLGQETLRGLSKKLDGKLSNPDKSKLTMLDLIFYNPKSNPMSVKPVQTPVLQKKETKLEVSEAVEETLEEQSVDDVESTAEALPVPQLKVGPDGQVMVDPHSLVIETTGMQKSREELENSQVVQESGITRYNSYSKRKARRSDWTPTETLQFYRALSTIGSDFSLMTTLFPKRSRHELKLKFKREERTNLHLIDKAMTIPSSFDYQALEMELKRENEEIERRILEKEKAKEAARKKRALRKEGLLETKRAKDRNIKMRNCAFKEFSNEEADILYEAKPKRRRISKRKSKKDVAPSEDTEEDSLGSDITVISLVSDIINSRKRPEKTNVLMEFEEINETLKKKNQLESRKKEEEDVPESEEDGYTPNGVGPYMLFGSPLKGPSEDEAQHEDSDEPQWNIDLKQAPTIEETVMVDNIEEVSELSELGSFGQSDVALDLSVPGRPNGSSEILEGNQVQRSLLDRHLISESIQIIDQLTSAEPTSENLYREVKKSEQNTEEASVEEEMAEEKIRLPSFESVNRSRPSMVYSLQFPNDSNGYEVSRSAEEVTEHSVEEVREIPRNFLVSNFYGEAEESILGD